MSEGSTRLLIDAGISGREIRRRLELVGESADGISAVCLTHEHSDHIDGLLGVMRFAQPRLYANSETANGVERSLNRRDLPWQLFSTGFRFEIGGLTVEPFSVPHDVDTVGFVFLSGAVKVAVVTDIGCSTTLVREKLKDCNAIILESNHDEKMLNDSNRPWSVKQRIKGRCGHLSNHAAGELIAEVAGDKLTHVFLAHMSAECNGEDIACKEMNKCLAKRGRVNVSVLPTFADKPSETWEMPATAVPT